MKVVIPYRDFKGLELKYCLRGIEKFVEGPEVTLIGDRPEWIKNVDHIPFKDNPELRWKERNIFQKISLVDFDFLFFNDDHFLLEPFSPGTYHYSGRIEETKRSLNNSFSRTLQNTIDLFGNIKNYFRHSPMFIKCELLKGINVDWGKDWGYCVKSIYCHLSGVEGTEYPDLKIRTYLPEKTIWELIKYRPYFSTGNHAVNTGMFNVLESLYPKKSKYEL